MGLTIKRVRGGWAVFSFGSRITAAMSRAKARTVKRHMAVELAEAA